MTAECLFVYFLLWGVKRYIVSRFKLDCCLEAGFSDDANVFLDCLGNLSLTANIVCFAGDLPR